MLQHEQIRDGRPNGGGIDALGERQLEAIGRPVMGLRKGLGLQGSGLRRHFTRLMLLGMEINEADDDAAIAAKASTWIKSFCRACSDPDMPIIGRTEWNVLDHEDMGPEDDLAKVSSFDLSQRRKWLWNRAREPRLSASTIDRRLKEVHGDMARRLVRDAERVRAERLSREDAASAATTPTRAAAVAVADAPSQQSTARVVPSDRPAQVIVRQPALPRVVSDVPGADNGHRPPRPSVGGRHRARRKPLRWAALAALASAATATGVLVVSQHVGTGGALPESNPSAQLPIGVVANGGQPVQVYAGPGDSNAVVGVLDDGAQVALRCAVSGQTFDATVSDGDAWYAIAAGGYASMQELDTGSADRVTPICEWDEFGGVRFPVAWTGGRGVDARSAPRLSAPVVEHIAEGTLVDVTCETEGDPVPGPFGTSVYWDRLSNGVYVPNASLNTQHDGRTPGIPECAAE